MIEAIVTQVIWQGSGCTLMARVLGNNAQAITKASLSALVGKATNLITGTQVSLTVSAASNVFDTLQTDAYWTEDATGYNFRALVPAAAIGAAVRYRCDFTFTPADESGSWVLPFEIPVKRTFT